MNLAKEWTDYQPFRGEYKGGSKLMRPKIVIFTSNHPVEACWHGLDLEPMLRRLHRIQFSARITTVEEMYRSMNVIPVEDHDTIGPILTQVSETVSNRTNV